MGREKDDMGPSRSTLLFVNDIAFCTNPNYIQALTNYQSGERESVKQYSVLAFNGEKRGTVDKCVVYFPT
jgi:hypothetical protein